MPENPLLPNTALQKLYGAMLRLRGAASGRPAGLEAILASVAQQLEPGDAVLSFAHADALTQLVKPAKRGAPAPSVLATSSSPFAFAAGVAAGARLAGSQRLAVALLDIRKPDPNWAVLMAHAQRERVPLIVICPELSSAGVPASGLTWASLHRVVKKLRFPVLTVDGADAVAMYRAMQESILRARHGDGPSLLWCPLPASARKSEQFPNAKPLVRLQRYLSARKIALPRGKAGSK